MNYIDLDTLIGINIAICEKYGQESVVINKDNLLSALSVQQWYDYDLRLMSSALVRSITIGHGFMDGNKRTAYAVGWSIEHYKCSESVAANCILRIACGELKGVREIASILYNFE